MQATDLVINFLEMKQTSCLGVSKHDTLSFSSCGIMHMHDQSYQGNPINPERSELCADRLNIRVADFQRGR